ncbi:hypothetical protein ZIOFF_045434 [Zingiber officinale]|uniref:DUF8040 domain-containing protein n=1 Tax=Zingiber officinale TaxID=94328 RepID=A0A8J5G6X8_ZINOF|nr:hypothetical protein ZIOFF_045434 [Zingiber officinale]
MDRRFLSKLCYLLTTHGKLKGNRNISINELVISFLHIITHNVKNRVLKRQTARSGETISRQFHLVLNSILRLHNILLKKPEPIPENCTDERWKWFKFSMEGKSQKMSNIVEQLESSMPPKFKRKIQSTKHLWTKQEDDVLVDCLVELSKDSAWKSENCFRTEYLVHLEKLMAAKLPSSSLKATPHIYGFGWNDVEKCIITTKDVLNDWVKSHPVAIGLRNKEFPHLDDLMFVWGKDHATGANAETPADAVEEINLCDEERLMQKLMLNAKKNLKASSRMKYGASRLKNFKKAKTAKNANSWNNASSDYHSGRRLFGDECAFCHSFRITEASGPMHCYKDGKLTALEEANQPDGIYVHEKCVVWQVFILVPLAISSYHLEFWSLDDLCFFLTDPFSVW